MSVWVWVWVWMGRALIYVKWNDAEAADDPFIVDTWLSRPSSVRDMQSTHCAISGRDSSSSPTLALGANGLLLLALFFP